MSKKEPEVPEKCSVIGCDCDALPGFVMCDHHMKMQYGSGYDRWAEINDDLA